MKKETLKEFNGKVRIISKELGVYEDKEVGTSYVVPTSYLFARLDYMELTNEELKKAKFEGTINNEKIDFNYITSKRPKPKYDITHKDEDKYTIVEAEIKVNQVYVVSNGLKFTNTFNNLEEAQKLLNEINEPLYKLF